ncbi:type B 50S ribosomal protein L31 [Williamsia sp. SKLECPSW1]
MKPGIHPDYHPVVFRDSSTGKQFLTRSTVTSDVTLEWEDGNRYPLVVVDVTSDSHPFWTGAHRVMDTAGRVQKFERRYGRRERPSSGARSQDDVDTDES